MFSVNFLGLLQITAIVLKLCHVIKWGWWWVFSPLLMSLVILGVAVGFAFGLSLLMGYED